MLYDWIKADPQTRGPMLNKWSECMLHKDWDFMCSKAVKELNALDLPVNDMTAWYYYVHANVVVLYGYNLSQGNLRSAQKFENCFPVTFLKSKYAYYIYSIAQQSDMLDNVQWLFGLLNCLQDLIFEKHLNRLDVTYGAIIEAAKHRSNMYLYLLDAQVTARAQMQVNVLADSTARQLLLNCTDHCIINILCAAEPQNILQELNDIDPMPECKFNSINQIHTAHMEGIKRAEEQIAKEHGDQQFIYDKEFKEIATKHGFKLFKSPAQMVIRGQQHNNCIAQYTKRQAYNDEAKLSRLLYNGVGTVELRFRSWNGVIYGVEVSQYKGKYNKDCVMTNELRDLCIALTGKASNIIKVEVYNVPTT